MVEPGMLAEKGVIRCVSPQRDRRQAVGYVDSRVSRLRPELLPQPRVLQQTPSHIHDRPPRALRNTVLLRCVRTGEGLVNPLLLAVVHEVMPRILPAVVAPQPADVDVLDLCTAQQARHMTLILLETLQHLGLGAHEGHVSPPSALIGEDDRVPCARQ
eukprot:56705-Eustigmatos_ZCMA.PRE.2